MSKDLLIATSDRLQHIFNDTLEEYATDQERIILLPIWAILLPPNYTSATALVMSYCASRPSLGTGEISWRR